MPDRLTILLVCLTCGDAPAQESVTSLEKEAGATRKAVASIEAIVTTKLDFPRLGLPQASESHIWITGNYSREDKVFTEDGVKYRLVKCVTPTELIYWKSDRIQDVEGMAIHRWRGDRLQEERSEILRFPRDPRLFGLQLGITNPLTTAVPIATIFPVNTQDRGSQKIQTLHIDDREMKELSFTTKHGASIKMLFDPSISHALCEISYTGGDLRGTVKTQYQQFAKSGLWFPHRITAEEHDGASRVYRDETIIKVISINSPIPHSTFSLLSLDLPPKQFQTYPKEHGPTYWDGRRERDGYRPVAKE